MLLYFSSAPVVPDSIDFAQYESLKAYKKRLGDAGLYFQYESLEQLRDHLQRHIAATMAEMHPRSGETAQQESDQENQLQQYRSHVEQLIRELDGEWVSFGNNRGVAAIEEAKGILAAALEQVLGLRAQVVSGLSAVTKILDDVAQEMRALRRHQLFVDGGRSAREFWRRGDALISRLKEIPPLLDDYAKRGN